MRGLLSDEHFSVDGTQLSAVQVFYSFGGRLLWSYRRILVTEGVRRQLELAI